ncbi:MAG: glycosyltransferase family 4 protein [Candidatus Thorarchaeota archaeon]
MSFKADKIICEIDYIKNMLVENFKVSPDKIEKMYLPAESFKTLNDQEKQNLLSFYRIKENKKILLFVGKISLVKGCDTLLKAFDIVRNKYNDAVLIMCGKIFDKSFAKHINSKDNSIIYIKPYIDYFKLYQLAEMVILPSRVEPFPFVMVESGSNKKAFVGGNTGGMKEFINNGKDGFLIDPENHSELAEKIIYLLNNKHATEQLGENLFKKVKEKCDYNKYFCKVDEIYNSLLDQ